MLPGGHSEAAEERRTPPRTHSHPVPGNFITSKLLARNWPGTGIHFLASSRQGSLPAGCSSSFWKARYSSGQSAPPSSAAKPSQASAATKHGSGKRQRLASYQTDR